MGDSRSRHPDLSRTELTLVSWLSLLFIILRDPWLADDASHNQERSLPLSCFSSTCQLFPEVCSLTQPDKCFC